MLWEEAIASLDDADLQEAVRLALKATKRAHATYSEFCVGAAVRSVDKPRYFTAANVENGSYGLTSCAERNAVFRAVAERGESVRFDLVALVAVADAIDPARRPTISPCGACRQVLYEFRADDGMKVVFVRRGRFVVRTLAGLLPDPFHLPKE